MRNASADHAKATHGAMMLGRRWMVSRMLHALVLIRHMMTRHLVLLHLGGDRNCLLCECHLQGHDVGGHDKAWQPANQEQAKAFSHIWLR